MRFLTLAVVVAAAHASAQLVCDPVSGCSCTAQSCVCTGTGCDLQCLGGSCTLSGTNGSRIACEVGAACSAQAGSNSSLTCEDGADCQVTLGANSTGLCTPTGHCVLTVGDGSNVTCQGTASNCSVTCTGACAVTHKPGGVALVCQGSFPSTSCSSTVTSCGNCPPADAGLPDAGLAIDAGQRDAGEPDAGAPDASVPDSGAPDADAGLADSGTSDAGDGGSVGPAVLALGCGCSSAAVPQGLVLFFLLTMLRRARR